MCVCVCVCACVCVRVCVRVHVCPRRVCEREGGGIPLHLKRVVVALIMGAVVIITAIEVVVEVAAD